MYITRLRLKNWRNFTEVDIPLRQRVFILGNNGLGKSNLLDAFRFLRDIANLTGGGLQDAIRRRGGIGKVRSLFARSNPVVGIGVDVKGSENGDSPIIWRYDLELKQEQRGKHRLLVNRESVSRNGKVLLNRPDEDDKNDEDNLVQTAIEQVKANKEFRPLAEFFQTFRYLHMVPQLVRHAGEFQGELLHDDPFGQGLMNNIAQLNKTVRKSRLRRISESLRKIKPKFGEFEFERDEKTGKPHLRFRYDDWRKHGSYQSEEQLSDGELRLIGLLWTLLESNEVIMLEEPEISFNEGIVRRLPGVFAQAVQSRKKSEGSQIILTTHSEALLADDGIGGEEVVLLKSDGESTKASLASADKSLANELRAGLSVADAALPLAQSAADFNLSG